MKPRVVLGRFLVRLGRFIQSLSVMVMRPDDLVEFSRQTYARGKNIDGWCQDDLVGSGLQPDEIVLLDNLPLRKGHLLLLAMGGGREAIPLAQMGFELTGVDFISEMVQKAKENAEQRGLKIEGIVQEISKLNVPPGSYNVVWLSAAMYSCVPTKKRRVNMLKRIADALCPEGYFICQFHRNKEYQFSLKAELARKAFSYLTLGNLWYEKGDMLLGDVEFIHAFSSEDELRSEFEEGGFEIVYLHTHEETLWGGAVLKRKASGNV